VQPLADCVFDQAGMHACVMAYGQTGSGKTFTMEGSKQQAGLITRTIQHLFLRTARADKHRLNNSSHQTPRRHGTKAQEERRDWITTVSVSMVEIYQDQIYDLLRIGPVEGNGRLSLRNHGENGVVVQGARVARVHALDEALGLYQSGSRLRRLGSSERNADSSRSHVIFALHIERCDPVSQEVVSTGKLSLVDLAGSERQGSTSALNRERVTQANAINKSLTALGKVVQACVVRAAGGSSAGGSANHVPYRDSILTRLLSDSIGGRAKTLLIAHVTPHACDAPESHCTLQFAATAACVQERISLRADEGRKREQVSRLLNENAQLKAELSFHCHTPVATLDLIEGADARQVLSEHPDFLSNGVTPGASHVIADMAEKSMGKRSSRRRKENLGTASKENCENQSPNIQGHPSPRKLRFIATS